jgi:bifunctional DNA-binding transcriptional regulator/antitoxin component of YhaV-PrlF toxin-antitoxin module
MTTLTRKHQIALPAAIVQALELAPGSQVEWSIGADGTLIGRPMPSRAQRATALYGAGRKYLRPDADPVRDLIAERLEDDDAYPAHRRAGVGAGVGYLY